MMASTKAPAVKTGLSEFHPRRRQQNAPPKLPPAIPSEPVSFFGSQIGDQTVINYSYTDSPWKLLAWDTYYFFYYSWALPYVLFPIRPTDSGSLSELAPTPGNIFCVFIHVILVVLQLGFILIFPPVALFIPLWTTILAVAVFMAVNKVLYDLLNGKDVIFQSDPQYAAPDQAQFAHEQWVFLNGVAVGSHWMESNLNRLALTFGRPIIGIHNRTSGILFDVVECLIQRNFGYATNDVRVCYRIMKEKLYNPQYSKVVFILHSQGGIEGGLVLDWLLQELPQNLLAKLEVYTFGNAANHFNDPYRTVGSQARTEGKALVTAAGTRTGVRAADTVGTDGQVGERHHIVASQRRPPTPDSPPQLDTTTGSRNGGVTTGTPQSPAPSASRPARAIGHIEHYAFTTDFVALWGVLHFATTPPASHAIPRFIGRLFARTSPDGRGGHQLVQHYLDGMFPLDKDPVTGQFVGAKEDNEFMETVVKVGDTGRTSGDAKDSDGGPLECLREGVIGAWLENWEAGLDGYDNTVGSVELHNGETPVAAHKRAGLRTDRLKVKDLSRLWKYRNGRSPKENPPLLERGIDGLMRGATM